MIKKSRIQLQMFWNSHKHQIQGYVPFNMVIEWLNMFLAPLTSRIKIFIQMLSPKGFYASVLKNLYFVNWAIYHHFCELWCTQSESHRNSAPGSKKQLRIWIRSERASRANVLKSLDSWHEVVIHTNVPTSNPSSDTMQCLAILV